jgi:hypothetical protein
VERATPAAYSGMVAAIAKWGTGTQELQNCKLAWQKSVDRDTSKIKLFQEMREASKNLRPICLLRRGVPTAQSSTPQ